MRTFLIAAVFAIVPSIARLMPQTDAGPAVTARLAALASWMAGVPALAFGTSAQSRLVPVLLVVMGTSGAPFFGLASRRPRIGSERNFGHASEIGVLDASEKPAQCR